MKAYDIVKDGDRVLCKKTRCDMPFEVGEWYIMRNYSEGSLWVVCENGLYSLYLDNFWEYFNTVREVRKLKLEKIGDG